MERSPTATLRSVLLREGKIHATNNEMWISADSGLSNDLAAVVPFKHLKSIAGMCRFDDKLNIQQVGSALGIRATASGGRWSLPTEQPESFPERPLKGERKPMARLPADQFHDLLKSVSVACAKDAGRFLLNGVLIEFTDGVLSFVGSDGHRMCIASCEIDQSLDDSRVLVPRKAVEALLRLSSLAGGERAVQLFAKPDTIEAWFVDEPSKDNGYSIGAVEFEALLLSGEYPNWRKALRKYSSDASRTPAGALLSAIEMCAVCSSETSRGITMTVSGGTATFKASSSECGKAESVCQLTAGGGEFSMTFDPRLASDWLALLDASEPVHILGEDAVSPLTLETLNCRCCISPIVKE